MTAKSRARKFLKKIHNKEKTNDNPRKLDRKDVRTLGDYAEEGFREGLESGRADRISDQAIENLISDRRVCEEEGRPFDGKRYSEDGRREACKAAHPSNWVERGLGEYPALTPEEDALCIAIEREFLN